MLANRIINSLNKSFIIRPLFNHFTAGENIISLENKAYELHKQKIFPIVDYVKEFSNNEKDIENNVQEYLALSKSSPQFIALKLSSFDFHYCTINNLIEKMVENKKKILIDAEDVKNQDKIEELTNHFVSRHNSKNNICIYKTYQMYRNDSLKKLEKDLNNYNYIGVKLVRGAYINQDKNSGLLFNTKEQTDESFNNGLKLTIQSIRNKQDNYDSKIYALVCTHNLQSIQLMINEMKKFQEFEINKNYVHHASLYGFINKETKQLVNADIWTFKYLPYGKMEDAIPYLLRRIQENPKILKYCFY
jgi:proline dehydrogenase